MSVSAVVPYVASFAATCLLAAFARHNRVRGWVRPRAIVISDLFELQTFYDVEDRTEDAAKPTATFEAPAVAAKPVYRRPPQEAETEFTKQLIRLQRGSGASTIAPTVRDREVVVDK